MLRATAHVAARHDLVPSSAAPGCERARRGRPAARAELRNPGAYEALFAIRVLFDVPGLAELAQSFGVNLFAGFGEIDLTAPHELGNVIADRAQLARVGWFQLARDKVALGVKAQVAMRGHFDLDI